jgi:hypothetical protein
MPASKDIPDLYLRFARLLKPPDRVLTFNYDTLLERALEAADVPFRLFPSRYKQIDSGDGLAVDDSREEVVILKMHGSIDWFDRSSYAQLIKDDVDRGFKVNRYDKVFSNMKELAVVPLLEGPRFRTDPLLQMYRVRNVEQLYRNDPLFHVTPSLLNPSSAKILYSQMLRDFWWGLGSGGVFNFSMAIIGFSLPVQDEYARQIIYRLVSNYQCNYWEQGTLDHKKTPLVIIDFRKSKDAEREFRRRYAFVDWTKAATYFGGFDNKALDLLC